MQNVVVRDHAYVGRAASSEEKIDIVNPSKAAKLAITVKGAAAMLSAPVLNNLKGSIIRLIHGNQHLEVATSLLTNGIQSVGHDVAGIIYRHTDCNLRVTSRSVRGGKCIRHRGLRMLIVPQAEHLLGKSKARFWRGALGVRVSCAAVTGAVRACLDDQADGRAVSGLATGDACGSLWKRRTTDAAQGCGSFRAFNAV